MTMQTEEFSSTQDTGADRIKDAAGGVASEAGRVAETRASETMTKVGDTLDQVAQAVREAGSGMREQQPQIAGFADTAAEQVEKASQYLREHDAREALETAQDFARRQPVAVVAGGLVLGLAVGRLLRTAGTSGRGGSSRFDSYGMTGSGTSYDRNLGSYGNTTHGGGPYGDQTFGRTTGGTLDGGSDYASGTLRDSAGTSTIASGAAIESGGAIDTGFASTPSGETDRATLGRIDTESSTEDR